MNMRRMSLILILGLFVVLAAPHNITLMEVPEFGARRAGVALTCYYVSHHGDPDLHSVKWYRDDQEIFRYTPGSQPPTRTFDSTRSPVTSSACDRHSCSVSVQLNDRWNTTMAYSCEVSTEGPRFAVVKETKNLTVAVPLRDDPVISGVGGTAQPGEEMLLNCSAGPAMPAPNIVWYLDGHPQPAESRGSGDGGQSDGPQSRWVSLRLKVPAAAAALRCEATQSARPPRHSSATLLLPASPARSMFTAYDSGATQCSYKWINLLVSVLYLIYKYSASNYEVSLT